MSTALPFPQRFLGFLKKNSYLLFAPLGALGLFLALHNILFFQKLENQTVDLRFQLRQKDDPKATDQLLLIPIDELSLTRFQQWPWPRSIHGQFLALLSQAKPAVIGWDILFTEHDLKDLSQDKALTQGAIDSGIPVVTGAILNPDAPKDTPSTDPGLTKVLPRVTGDIHQIKQYSAFAAKFPYPELAQNSLAGFVDSHPGNDGIRRTLPMVVRAGDLIYPSLDTQVLMQYWHLRPKDVWVSLGHSIDFHTLDDRIGIVRVPIDIHGEALINYRNRTSFQQISYATAVSALASMLVEKKPWPANYPTLDGKILMVGQVAEGLTDLGPNPLEGIAPLVLTHFNLLNNILKGDFASEMLWPWVALAWLVVAYPSLYFTRQASILVAILVPLSILTLYALGCYFIFRYRSIVAPFVWPAGAFFAIHAGSILLRWLEEQKSKQAIKAVFGSFVSSSVMNQLLKSPENVKLGGDSKPVTIFFSDIRGFSTFAEGMTDQELITQLNEYFVRMVNRVIVNDGTLHKFIGDAVMAVWGDVLPGDLALDAKKAVRASLQMRRELADLNKLRKARGLFDFKIGMGLNHGTVVVGNIGAEGQKLEFTVIGDPVNLASRLEGVTKQFHTDLVIGESVRAFLGDEFLLRSIGLLTVKGKTIPIRAYEVFEELADPDGVWDPVWVHTYEKGFNLYLSRDFAGAIACFETCLTTHPDDFCTNEYYRESREYLQNPPPPDWSGVLKLDSK